MVKGNISDVGYRYLQSRRGASNTLCEAIWYSFISVLAIVTLKKVPRWSSLCLLINLPHVPPNVGNYFTYKKNKQACENYLLDMLDEDKFDNINKLKFNQSGMKSLNNFFNLQNIDTSSIKCRTGKEDSLFDCWNLDR